MHQRTTPGPLCAREPVAIIGMSCRLPGAENPEAYWRLLEEGREAIVPIPPERWDADEYYDPTPKTPGKTVLREAGLIQGMDRFDPYFFGISPREAESQDPQQRLLLEVAWEALEDAGLMADGKRPSGAGVFVGYGHNDYADLLRKAAAAGVVISSGSGGGAPGASGRLSTVFGFNGPSLTVDTACSSSLVATHLACNAIANGDCETALVAGVNALLTPDLALALSQAGLLSPDCRCQAFSAKANGFVRSEGAVVIVVKSLSAALADGNRIHAVIKGSSVSNDGSYSPLMTPSEEAQVIALRRAYAAAGVSPSDVDYVEAHGTGTKVGDPIEAAALSRVLGEGRAANAKCKIGSCKSNIGHAEAAAGLAGVLKTVLSMKRGVIPASLHCEELNPQIPWHELAVEVQRTKVPWPRKNSPALAGVNSFGISGTNAHVVIEEAPRQFVAPVPDEPGPRDARRLHLLTLSARSEDDLSAVAAQYERYLQEPAGRQWSLREIAVTSGVRRKQHEHRLAVVGADREEIVRKLRDYAAGEDIAGLATGFAAERSTPKVAFVYSGAGSQWIGMGCLLRNSEPVFHSALERCDTLFRAQSGWSVIEAIDAPESVSRMGELPFQQPAIFSIQVALTELWRSWNVHPAAVVGHSLGEHAAAYAAGALTLEDAVRTVHIRSSLMATVGPGRMLAVGISAEEAAELVRGKESRVGLAVINSPTSIVLSGDGDVLEAIKDRMDAADVFCRWVKTDTASHSPHMEAPAGELVARLQGIEGRVESVPFYSSLMGGRSNGTALTPEYWGRALRQTVRFSETARQAMADGFDVFVELSPHPLLLAPLRQTSSAVTTIGCMRRGEDDRVHMLEALGALYTRGHSIDWGAQCQVAQARYADLPSYPWRRERYWVDAGSESAREKKYARHPMLDRHWVSARDANLHIWETRMSGERFRFIGDHRAQGTAIMPAAGYLEMALAASIERSGPGPRVFANIELLRALAFPAGKTKFVQLTLAEGSPREASFHIYSRQLGADEDHDEWLLHCRGSIRHGDDVVRPAPDRHFDPEELGREFPDCCDTARFYELNNAGGMDHGAHVQGVQTIWYGQSDRFVARVKMPDAVRDAHRYHIHPGLWDTLFHAYGVLVFAKRTSSRKVWMPTRIGRVEIRELPKPDQPLWATGDQVGKGKASLCNVRVYDTQGRLVLAEDGHQAEAIESKAEDLTDWLYRLEWRQEASEPEAPAGPGAWLLIGGGPLAEDLAIALAAKGDSCVLRRAVSSDDDLMPALERNVDGGWRIVFLSALTAPENEGCDGAALAASHEETCGGALLLAQQAARHRDNVSRIFLVTRGAQAVGGETKVNLAQAALLGLGRVIRSEMPSMRPALVDLDPARPEGELNDLVNELNLSGAEKETALRSGVRWVRRLVRMEREEESDKPLIEVDLSEESGLSARLETAAAGIVDNLSLRVQGRQRPKEGEVEVRISAVGLNFIDVLGCYGMLPGQGSTDIAFGLEGCGRVVAVGEGVSHVGPADEVIVLGRGAGVASAYVTAPASSVCLKPKHLTAEEAATTFVAYQTAHYSLIDKARLQPGETVLIHSAAGGVGLAAVAIARRIGARVFATVGRPEKRELLESLGAELVMDSHALGFAAEILEHTAGKGVDVALNSLAGAAISKTLEALAIGGRFVEIGKRDIYANTEIGLWPFQKNLSYFAVDLLRLSREQPETVARLTEDVLRLIADGTYGPLPYRSFRADQAADAFRHMAQGAHIGKVLLSFEAERASARPPLRTPEALIQSSASYLITGGFGGLGLVFADWLVRHGARHLVLMGRKGETEETAAKVAELRASGAKVLSAKIDVGSESELAALLAKVRATMPPIRGVIHSAAVLSDGILEQLDWPRFEAVFSPKVAGGWNLHRLLEGDNLDFFVLFSSAASTLGSSGQGNYAAANAFLDGLTELRRSRGLPATCVNWGPWAEVGLAAAQANRGERMAEEGLGSIAPDSGVRILENLLAASVPQAIVLPVDWPRWIERRPEVVLDLTFQELIGAAGVAGPDGLSLKRELASASDDKGLALVEKFLAEALNRVLRIPIDRLDPRTSLIRLGLDSLMAVELQTRIDLTLGVSIPIVRLLDGPSSAELAGWIWDDLRSGSNRTEDLPQPKGGEGVEDLDQEEVDSMLADLGSHVGRG